MTSGARGEGIFGKRKGEGGRFGRLGPKGEGGRAAGPPGGPRREGKGGAGPPRGPRGGKGGGWAENGEGGGEEKEKVFFF
jgi:hypothetical protein